MIEVTDIEKRFGRVRAVGGVSFDVGKGEVAGLLGANGAGKTTTLRMITGFLPPDAGVVKVMGLDVVERSLEARRQVGYLPESAPAYSEMLAIDFLNYRAKLFGLDRKARRARVSHVIDRCGLEPVERRRVGHLSKGFRQRVGLAAAMLHDPPVLVLDEPTNGLDPTQIREARNLIQELAQERTVLISSHILPEIERVCDRLIIMAAGRVRANGKTSELLANGEGRYYAQIKPKAGETTAREAVASLIRDVQGVRAVRAEESRALDEGDGWVAVSIDAERGAGDLREPIALAAGRAGAVVRELRAERASLERLFLQIMETEETPGGGENREVMP
jgi:gliding motility-associated transport system ATP-binding protein